MTDRLRVCYAIRNEIGNRAFYNCRRLSSVIIPESVRAIGDEAFALCPQLDVSIPGTVSHVDERVACKTSVLDDFLAELTALTQKYEIAIGGCCDSPYLSRCNDGAQYGCDGSSSNIIGGGLGINEKMEYVLN